MTLCNQGTQELPRGKHRFKLITNVTIFAALNKSIPVVNKDKQPYKNHLFLFLFLTMYERKILILNF